MSERRYFPEPVAYGLPGRKFPSTLERLRRRYQSDRDRGLDCNSGVATVGPYAITSDEDLYFRALYAGIKLGYKKPQLG